MPVTDQAQQTRLRSAITIDIIEQGRPLLSLRQLRALG
jgi:hypothetical protein